MQLPFFRTQSLPLITLTGIYESIKLTYQIIYTDIIIEYQRCVNGKIINFYKKQKKAKPKLRFKFS